jgi:hypothetical protein
MTSAKRQKEKDEGKVNSVLLYLKENPEAGIEDSIAFVREILDEKKKEFLQNVLMDGFCDLPKPCKHLHLSCLKVFQMFFNSTNRYDSNTEMLQDINKAFYLPLEVGNSKPLNPLPLQTGTKKEHLTINSYFNRPSNSKHYMNRQHDQFLGLLQQMMDQLGKCLYRQNLGSVSLKSVVHQKSGSVTGLMECKGMRTLFKIQ